MLPGTGKANKSLRWTVWRPDIVKLRLNPIIYYTAEIVFNGCCASKKDKNKFYPAMNL